MPETVKLLIAVALVALFVTVGWKARDVKADAEIAALKLERAEAIAAAQRDSLRYAKTTLEALDAEKLRSDQLQADRRRAVAAGDRVRDELQATRAWAEQLDTSAAEGRAAAAETIAVLTDLLGRCSGRGREVADYADRATSAAQTCIDAWPRAPVN